MPIDPKTILQILVLAVGAHIVLSFLRTTRGSGMVRGVLIALVVIFGALLGLARWMELSELRYIVETVAGFAVVILAIVFQPELRRGIVSLGDNPLLRSVMGSRSNDAVDEVAAACVGMAKRKHGALIAFERNSPLDAWTQKAVKIDARVTRHLLDSIFYPGGALHDGAVILREGRVAAAMAILPLSERENLARSIGTRHRAALGLSEETDAIVVAVSEETGLITVCQDGAMERKVAKDELAGDLRARLGGDEQSGSKERTPFMRRSLRLATSNLGQKALALVFGIALFYAAFRSVRTTQSFGLQVRVEAGESASTTPVRNVLRIVLPSEDVHLVTPRNGFPIQVTATAAQADLAAVTGGLGGVLIVDKSWVGSERTIDAETIRWGLGRVMDNLDVELRSPESLVLAVDRYATAEIAPKIESFFETDPEAQTGGDNVTTTGSRTGTPPDLVGIELPPGVEIDRDSLEFDPGRVTMRGPAEVVRRFKVDPGQIRFEPIDLTSETGRSFVARLHLDPDVMGEVHFDEDLFLRGNLLAPETTLGTLEFDIVLVSFDPEHPDPSERFVPPTETVTVRILVRGMRLDLVDESSKSVMVSDIINFVRQRARIFVDVSNLDGTEGSRVPVEHGSLDPLWREELGPYFAAVRSDPTASLRLEIDSQDQSVALTRRNPTDDEND